MNATHVMAGLEPAVQAAPIDGRVALASLAARP
jgi:hypothetical protein